MKWIVLLIELYLIFVWIGSNSEKKGMSEHVDEEILLYRSVEFEHVWSEIWHHQWNGITVVLYTELIIIENIYHWTCYV